MASMAKLFMHGRSQAVRLPKEFLLPGKEVRVSKVGDKVTLKPLEKPPYDSKAFWARIDALGGRDFPEVGDDDLRLELDGVVSFVVVALLNERPPTVRVRFDAARGAGAHLALSVIVLFELQFGAANSARPGENWQGAGCARRGRLRDPRF